jgi:hypothetical protein
MDETTLLLTLVFFAPTGQASGLPVVEDGRPSS